MLLGEKPCFVAVGFSDIVDVNMLRRGGEGEAKLSLGFLQRFM
jgi:hypothetical protein